MRKKAAFALLFTFAFVLTGCMNDVAELYEGHAYDTGVFSENYYSIWNDSLKNSVAPVAKTYDVTAANSFQIEQDSDFAQLWSPDGFADGKAEPYYSYFADTPHEDAGYGYGPSNNLIAVDDAFARGFLSRLYDGRIHCDGITYAQTRVQIDGSGYGTLFPKEMMSYRYFALSLRGADESSNYDFAMDVNINLTFYVYNHDSALYVPYLFQMKNFPIMTNSGGRTTIIGFYFAGVMGADVNLIRRASGMSITFSLEGDYEDYTIDREDTTEGKEHFALMLYEVLLPKSTWN
jgi:hypothetical protein